MIDLEHLMLYDGKPWKFSDFNEPLVIDLQGLKYKQGGVPVIVKGKPDGYADIKIAPIDKRDEIGLAIYADVHVEDGKLPENYTVGLDINIDDKYYMHPGTNLEINQDKWIVSSKGVWIAEPVTINAVYISEETTTTWLIEGWRNTIIQQEQKTEKKEMEHTQTDNYDLSQPICENPQLALEALKQIIQANQDGNNETAIFMTVKRCQTCGAWPTCRLDGDGENVAIVIGCPQDPSHARYIGSGDETVKDIIRMWNHQNSNPFMEDRKTRNIKSETEIAYTQQQIDSYSMVAPISQDVNCALAVLKQIIQENMQDSCIATMPIRRCPQCNALPTCRLDDKSTAIIMECVKGGHQHSYYCSKSNDSLTKIIIKWNQAQEIVGNLKSVKDKKFDDYDWDAPITGPWLAKDVFNDCIRKQSDLGNAEMAIVRCARCGEYPVADVAVDTFVLGCPKCKRIFWARKCDSLTAVATDWNREQEIRKAINGGTLMNPKPEETEHKETEMEMDYEQGRINNYGWNEPVSKHLEIAYEALQQCIVNNFSPFPTYNPKMTIARHWKTGRQPVAFINKDNESIGLGLAGGDGYWTDGSMSLKDLVNMWNKAQDAEEKHDDAITSEMIEKYDWNEPIKNNMELAACALEACIERNFPEKSQFDGAFMYGIPAKMEILRHRNSGEIPKVMKAEDGSNIGIGVEGLCYVWACPSETLTTLVNTWNKLQGKDGKHDDAVNAETTSTAVDSYDWDAPISVDDKLLADVVQHCLEQQETGNGIPKMHICLCKDCCQPPMVFNKEHHGNTFFGCDNPKHASIPINANMSLTEVVESWNRLQGVPAEKTEDEPPKETSLDIMGRNALALPQQAKTIEELEAEADRGLSKPEDVQKLKEANVLTDVQKAIAEVCDEIKELLLEKNRKYGNSALNPCRIFARSDRLEQIRVRIDDKLNRIKNEQGDEDEDVVKDLIGYLVLYTVAQLYDFNN